MKKVSMTASKVVLSLCNFLLLVCGSSLIMGGLLVLFDTGRVLLSRLLSAGALTTMPHPLLYYLGVGVVLLGVVLTATGVLGCWAACLHSGCMLITYFLAIMLVLVGECVVYLVTWAWPTCLGLNLGGEELTKSLQRNYGVAGQEQFTVAIDLAQTLFKCCGIYDSNEYDTSLWRLQSLGPKLAIPLTCCILNNLEEPKSYLNPHPSNSTLCQALEPNRHEGYRYRQGCIDQLEQWYREQYIIFLAMGLVVVLVEFCVLLSTIFAFTRMCQQKVGSKDSYQHQEPSIRIPKIPVTTENVYQRRCPGSYESYALTNSFRQNYKLSDLV